MIRVLITMTEEQRRRLKSLSGGNTSGFIQVLIDKLYTLKGEKDYEDNHKLQIHR